MPFQVQPGLEGAIADVQSLESDIDKSKQCVRLVFENLLHLKDHPEDVAARDAMCLAANYGGNAINKQLAGYVHAFAHSIGGKYHIPHGKAIAMCILPVIRSQMDSCFKKLNELAEYCSFSDVEAMLDSLESLIKQCDLNLNGSVINPEDFNSLAIAIAKDSINYSAPITFNHQQIIDILSEMASA